MSRKKKKKVKIMWMWTDKAGNFWLCPSDKEADRCIREEYNLSEDEFLEQLVSGENNSHLISCPLETRNLRDNTVEVRIPGSGWQVVEMQPVPYTL